MLNQVTLVGRLTKGVVVRYTPEGKAVAVVIVACKKSFRNSTGEYEADLIQCALWGRQAENTALYCDKGSVIGITGRITTRSYENE